MTSQLDFFGVVVVAVALVSEPITGECSDGTCNSSEICGVRVCRSDVERRPIPLREFVSLSFFLISHTNKCYEIKKKLNKYTHITAMKLFELVSHAAVEMSLNEVVKRK